MRAELFMYFCIKNYSGTHCEFLSTIKYFSSPEAYAIDRVPRRWSLYCFDFVRLCGFN